MVHKTTAENTIDLTAQHKLIRKSFFIAFIVFVFFMIITLVGWRNTSVSLENRKKSEFEMMANQALASIEKRVDTYITILNGTRGLFAASQAVDRNEWSAYVKAQNLPIHYPSIVALSFIQRVPSDQKEAFVTEFKAEGFTDFSIHPFDQFKGTLVKSEYFVIKYQEPPPRDRSTYGLDVSTEPTRWTAYERARTTEQTALSGAVPLLEGQKGFIMAAPIYKHNVPFSSFNEKRAAFEGFVDAVIDTEVFFHNLFEKQYSSKGIELQVFDGDFSGTDRPASKLVFNSGSEDHSKAAYQWMGKVKAGGVVWTLYFYSTPTFKPKIVGSEVPTMTLIVGSVFSFLLWGILYSLTTSRFRALTLAHQMTQELRENESTLVRAIADLKKTHTELRQAQSHLIQAEKAESITELAAGAAHEVKNPLAILLQGVDYLNKHITPNGSETGVILKEMEEAIKRADSIIKGLLNLSRSTQLVVVKENLNSVIEESLMLVKIFLDRNHIKTVKELDQNIPLLMIDKGKIIQVFINLITNAIHAMPENGTLCVKTYLTQLSVGDSRLEHRGKNHFSAGQNVVVAEIEDSGDGISDLILPKIFDPFFTTRRTKGGTGLGLSVVRTIVEMHGGLIELQNKKDGKGVRAVVTFPIFIEVIKMDSKLEQETS